MLFQIISLLLEVVAGLLAGACLLRLYMQHQRIPMSTRSGNPLGRFIFALTDWIVLPLRRVMPALGRWDLSSLLAAYLIVLAQYLLLWLLVGAGAHVGAVPLLAVFALVRLVISGLSALVIVYAILSWVQAHSPLADIVHRLVAPPLAPIRRVIPLAGGVDLSPLVLLVGLQILNIVLAELQTRLLL